MNKKLIFVILAAIAVSYLTYSSPFSPDYEAGTAQQKQDFIWGKALADNGKLGSFAAPLQLASLIAPLLLGGQDFEPVGHNESDQNAHGRRKLIHSVSKSAKILFNFESNPYTGAFAEKSCLGIIRASAATKPTAADNAPGMAIKLFRDKVPSGNFVAMWSLFGQANDSNFFSHPFSNHVSDIPFFQLGGQWLQLKALSAKFKGQDADINMVGLSDLAKYTNAGAAVSSPKAPFSLVFKPNPALTNMCKDAPLQGENYGCFDRIASGTLLYTVYYTAGPVSKSQASPQNLKKLGTITSASKFVASQFMDETVQFKHVLWADEVKALGMQKWNSALTSTFKREDGAEKWEQTLEKM